MKTSSANWRKVDKKRSSFEYHLNCTWTLNTGLVKWRKQEIQMRIDEERLDNIFSVQWRRCECNLLVGWAQGDSDHLCSDDNRENCSPWSVVAPRQARGSWSTRLISSYSYHYTTHCSCHWGFWLQAQVWHLGRWQHVLNNYEKPRFSLHYMWHIVTYP